MIEKKFIVKNKHGLHLRPATELIKLVSDFNGDIFIIKDEIKVNGKSILGILSLGINYNDSIVIRLDGKEEKELLAKLENFFNKEE